MRTHGVVPPGIETVMGSPGRSTFTAVLPFGVETSSHLTGAPIAAALVVR